MLEKTAQYPNEAQGETQLFEGASNRWQWE